MDRESIRREAEKYIHLEEHPGFRDEVQRLLEEEDWGELSDRFYADLSFGTGGLRGIIGGGYNRMNPYNVRRATQGLANYIRKNAGVTQDKEGAVVIAYDSRLYSDLFAREAARVLAGNAIKTYVFSSLRPTPELSFAVRRLSATAGIVITASHNPKTYNGYKVYWEDGGQIVPPQDGGIIEEVRKAERVSLLSERDAEKKGLLIFIDKEIDDPYLDMVKNQSLRPDLVRSRGNSLKVVYTPLHGAGAMPVSHVLTAMGVDVHLVPEQKQPDGNFPTVEYPNPEEADALAMAVEMAERLGADLVLGTDPDSDRLGIAAPVRDGQPGAGSGEFVLLNGNQLGSLLADYIFSTMADNGSLPPNPVLIKTIVTTDLQKRIAESYGAACIETLTGFKYIAEKIRQFEAAPDGPHYVFGGEESYGYLVGTSVRDKDAVSASAMTAEMALYHQSRGSSLIGRLDEVYRKYGYFQELLLSRAFPGQDGFRKMTELIEGLRKNPKTAWAGIDTSLVRDYLTGETLYLEGDRRKRDLDLPKSNVLQFVLSDESKITVRPSGTEPKIKFYASCCGPAGPHLAAAKRQVGEKIQRIRRELEELIIP